MTAEQWILRQISAGFEIELSESGQIVIRPGSKLSSEDRQFIAQHRQMIVLALRPPHLGRREQAAPIYDYDRRQVWDQAAITRAIVAMPPADAAEAPPAESEPTTAIPEQERMFA